MTRFTFIDLFAGIGGTRLAFERAGGKCLFASEIDEYARRVYSSNFGDEPSGDIKEIEEKTVPNHDVLLARVPAKFYNMLKPRRLRERREESLSHKVVRILEVKRPGAFFFEGMPGLLSFQGDLLNMKPMLEDELGYNTHMRVIDASCVVPQWLKRLYITGFKEKEDSISQRSEALNQGSKISLSRKPPLNTPSRIYGGSMSKNP